MATIRGLFVQTTMRPIRVVITEVLDHEAFQMALIEYDDVIEQVAPTGADPTLRNTVLPRTAETGPLGLDAKAHYRVDYFFGELRAASIAAML